jgi:hypothetical protein
LEDICHLNRCLPVAGFPDDLELSAVLEHGSKEATCSSDVIGDENPKGPDL